MFLLLLGVRVICLATGDAHEPSLFEDINRRHFSN